MVKISRSHHVTKDGVIKKNPVKHYRGHANQEREYIINVLVNKIQQCAFIKISDVEFAKSLINERVSDQLLMSPFWKELSTDKSSGVLFKQDFRIDPTDCVVFVNIDYLRARKGNTINQYAKDSALGKGVDKMINLMEKGVKLEGIPYFKLRDDNVAEGNHRVEALYQLGYKTCPVTIGQGWQ